MLGLLPAVLGGDDRLSLVNYSGKTIVVAGYEGEPFLRFTKEGVYENTRSPATYLSRERDPARAKVPASADASAPPEWRKIAAAAQSVVWHDHRIHWTKPTPPRVVAEAPDETHKIFDWAIPATADGQPIEIAGFLGYRPPPSQESRRRDEPVARRRGRRALGARSRGVGGGGPVRDAGPHLLTSCR